MNQKTVKTRLRLFHTSYTPQLLIFVFYFRRNPTQEFSLLFAVTTNNKSDSGSTVDLNPLLLTALKCTLSHHLTSY